jgi:hypothetical protein
MTQTQTLASFIDEWHIRVTATRTDRNPSMEDSANMDHWRVRLIGPHGRMSLVFSKGYGHNGEPPAVAEVLSCLASDAAGIENARDFADWCSEYGFDTDSRKAERIYRTLKRQAVSLNRIMGNDGLYQRLLFHTERE